jgi:Uma2 family endonuclease
MSAQPQPRLSPEEYLALERAAEVKSEYYDGHMYAMSGGSYPHAKIIVNVSSGLQQALKGKACSVTSSDVRFRVSPQGLYTYPDVMVVCGPPKFADNQRDTLLNPTLIVEVLSQSTEAHDRGFKFAQYQQLDSLEEYVLVSQIEPRVESFRRQMNGKWLYSDVRGIAAICRFDSVDCEVPLSEIYYQVAFDSEPPLPRV